jgi:glyoxylase-like metal-dependent hydrolase (beta-lactamase superfamily II)
MDRLWGEVAPVPSANVVVLTGGERIGPFAVDYAPGHASHHVTYRHDSGDAFVGDVGGVRIAPEAYVRPPTPPPDIDIEAWNESLDRLQAAAPRRLLLTHFGAFDDPAQQITRLRGQLARWAQRARELDDPASSRTNAGSSSSKLRRPQRSTRRQPRSTTRPRRPTNACKAFGATGPSARSLSMLIPDEPDGRAPTHRRARYGPRSALECDRPQ